MMFAFQLHSQIFNKEYLNIRLTAHIKLFVSLPYNPCWALKCTGGYVNNS